jgi:hypothetical protein
MKYRLIFPIAFLLAFLFAACGEKATIKVTNSVHNVQLDNINFDQFGVGSSILPGESTQEVRITTHEGAIFPIKAPLQFYMVKGGRRVFLETKKIYTLNANDRLKITIDDQTEVVNSLTN